MGSVPRTLARHFTENLVEICCSDGSFYQLRSDGRRDLEVVARIGAVVCWYNVGRRVHTISGGPWDDSGDVQSGQSFIWVANQEGSFAFYCRHSAPGMTSALRVTR